MFIITGKFAKYQKCLWDLIEKPHTSTAAKVSSQEMYQMEGIQFVGQKFNDSRLKSRNL